MDLERVMVASDTLEGIEPAMGKAGLLANAREARIRVVQVLHDPLADEPADVLPAEERERLIAALTAEGREALAALAERFRERGPAVEWDLLWSRNAAETIAEAARSWPAQLLVKPVSPHHPLGDLLHTPLDWALMRRVSSPVLISRGSAWPPGAKVLAAVDAGDGTHEALNGEIVRRAATLAAILGLEWHVATAYPDLGQTVNQLQVARDFEGIKADMRDTRRRNLLQLLARLGLEPAEIHLLEGRPAHRIPELATRLPASLTVVGTAAREGLARLAIGNTAEVLIGRLPGDLVTVRAPWS